MKVLFDLRSYQISARRGIGRYFLSLCKYMLKDKSIEPYFLISKHYDTTIPDGLDKNATVLLAEDFANYDIKENFDFLFKGNFFDEHNYSFNTILPPEVVEKCNKLVGITHDVIPLVFANNYLKDDDATFVYANHMDCLRLTNYLFANSECTKHDTAELVGYPKKDITVIYGGADEDKFKSLNSNKEYDSTQRTNNIVFVPGEDLRKNFQGAAKAFAMAYESGKIPQNAKLYLVCKSSEWFVNEVKKAIAGHNVEVGKQIIVTGFMDDDLMLLLLSNARASIFPSFYEGLGLPILESYIAGTPSFASNISSTKEFVDPECSFDPYDMDELSNLIIRIYNDEKLCRKSLEFGRKLVKSVNWENAAKKVVEKLKELYKTDNREKKVAVFTCLPPQKSGIAGYSYKTHSINPELFDMISDVEKLEDYQDLLGDNFELCFDGKDLSFRDANAVHGTSLLFENKSEKDIVSFGPYIALPAGRYNLKIEYEADKKAGISFRFTADCGKIELLSGVLDAKKQIATIPFELNKAYKELECSIYFSGKSLLIKKISFKKDIKTKKLDNIIPYVSYPYAHLHKNYIGKIFVIGNSEHHKTSLMEAIKTKGEKHRLLYLHEAFVLFAFYPYLDFNEEKIKQFIAHWYPQLYTEIQNVSMGELYNFLRSKNIGMIRPLIALSGIKHIAVNNDLAKKMILDELTDKEKDGLKIDVLFHPIEDYSSVKKIELPSKTYTVGSFGMPLVGKYSDLLINAVKNLNENGHKVNLILAGYSVSSWLKENSIENYDWLIPVDGPSDEYLSQLMHSVDVAVQLRKSPHGESSGCVSQLLGMDQNIITNTGFISLELEKYCTAISDVNIDTLGTAILKSMKGKHKHNDLCKKYSFAELAKKLYNLSQED